MNKNEIAYQYYCLMPNANCNGSFYARIKYDIFPTLRFGFILSNNGAQRSFEPKKITHTQFCRLYFCCTTNEQTEQRRKKKSGDSK